ncbi:hypothetical protein BDQ12DRAFT_724306 [Crucibulum laeve]|uniref:Hydrophobin n=1 Tax=Crucibulum laeve TaxID=68775 RepID=A0A5C3LW68_9AGAR|nr:hypothetical protein BDQ12DRAFT_724306 [Crucibulum laeve]
MRETVCISNIQCCNSLQSAESAQGAGVLGGPVGISAGCITGLIGLSCTPISVLGIGGNNCTAQTACCLGKTYGTVTVGCNHINLDL